jgi:hypothetical protein
MLRDVLVSHVSTAIYPDRPNQWIAGGRLQALIGDQDCFEAEPLGGSEHKLLDVTRRSIRIYPDLQSPKLQPGALELSIILRNLRIQLDHIAVRISKEDLRPWGAVPDSFTVKNAVLLEVLHGFMVTSNP